MLSLGHCYGEQVLSWVRVVTEGSFVSSCDIKFLQSAMTKVSPALITVLFVFSILSLIATLALLAIIFGLNSSALNFSTIAVSCSKNYFSQAWIYVYLPLRAHTITGLILLCLTVPVIVVAGKLYWSLRDLPSEAQQDHKVDRNMLIALYILSSFQTLFAISNWGGKMSILIDNKNCTVMDNSKLVILMVVSLLAFLIVLIQWILVLAIDCSTQEQQPISIKDLQGNEVAKEEDAISKHLEMQMKEYFTNNLNQKEQMMEGLLKRDDQIYGQNASIPPFNPTRSIPNSTISPQGKTSNLPNQQKKKKRKKQGDKKGKNPAAIKHFYPSFYQGQERGAEAYYYGQQNDSGDQQSDEESQEQQVDEQLLHTKEDDNLSEKFEQNNFELDYQLNRAIRNDKQEDLSPLELKEIMHLSKAAFMLKGSGDKGLDLQRGYDIPEGFKIRVNFVKIKQHKELQRQQVQKLIDEPNPIQQKQSQEKAAKEIEVEDKPPSEETSKLLKVILFNNSHFYKKPEDTQTQCPIARYVQNDVGFEIILSQKADKHKKFEYSKQQLIFSKKRKDNYDDTLKEKGTLRKEFNQSQFIKIERRALFGEDWINKYDRKEDPNERNRQKRTLADAIRSKYYQ